MSSAVLRFAPSPNGPLHLGHAYSALLNHRLAHRLGGRFLVRMEDIDPVRCRPIFEAAILADLDWLGLRSEGPVRRQSEHLADHAAAFRRLRSLDVVYPCFCSRGDVRRAHAAERAGRSRDPDGAPLYPGTCRQLGAPEAARRLADGVPHLWRLNMDEAVGVVGADITWTRLSRNRLAWNHSSETPFRGTQEAVRAEPALWGDAVLVRRDVPTSYHLSVVVDDALQAITHVVRGRDLEKATDLHVLLQRLLGYPTPLYLHHRLILGADGQKLSKSRDAPALAELREAGESPEDVARRFGL